LLSINTLQIQEGKERRGGKRKGGDCFWGRKEGQHFSNRAQRRGRRSPFPVEGGEKGGKKGGERCSSSTPFHPGKKGKKEAPRLGQGEGERGGGNAPDHFCSPKLKDRGGEKEEREKG